MLFIFLNFKTLFKISRTFSEINIIIHFSIDGQKLTYFGGYYFSKLNALVIMFTAIV